MRSFVTPFQVVGGRIATTSNVAQATDQKIIDVLVTGKMERPAMPEYGAAAQQLVFEPLNELLEVDFKTDAALEIGSRISGVSIIDIKVEQQDETTAKITVYYKSTLSAVRTLVFQVSAGLLTEESII